MQSSQYRSTVGTRTQRLLEKICLDAGYEAEKQVCNANMGVGGNSKGAAKEKGHSPFCSVLVDKASFSLAGANRDREQT